MYEFQKATGKQTLNTAWDIIRRKPKAVGIDGITVAEYAEDVESNLERLRFALTNDMYRPDQEMKVALKQRDIQVSCIEDKIVQTSVAIVLQGAFTFPACVHSFIKGRSIYTAQSAIKEALSSAPPQAFVKVDIEKYYDSIDNTILLNQLREKFDDERFIDLIRIVMHAGMRGISTGSCLSPVLSNIYLIDFDIEISRSANSYIRYVDDMLISLGGIEPDGTDSEDSAPFKIAQEVEARLKDLNLTVNKEKTSYFGADEPFTYLGFEFRRPAAEQKIEALIESGDFAAAEELLTQQGISQSVDVVQICGIDRIVPAGRNVWRDNESGRYQEPVEHMDSKGLSSMITDGVELAVDVIGKDKRTTYCVFDIDVNRQTILEHGDDSGVFNALILKTFEVAISISAALVKLGIRSYLESSGYKGYHLWVFWKSPVSVKDLKAFYNSILPGIEIPEGVHIEKFPASEEPVQKIKLPGCIHSVSGKRSFFVTDTGKQIEESEILEFVENDFPANHETAKKSDKKPEPAIPAHISAIANKCAVIAAIVKRAEKDHYLNYHEKSALLYTFGCLGDEGRKHIHRILSGCMDYNYSITEKELERCAGLYPIGCKKLFERFEDNYPNCKCSCTFDLPKMYPSPVCHAIKVKPGCYMPPKTEEKLGHFKQGSAKMRINELISKYAELTKKSAEVHQQQSVCGEQIDLIFERNGVTEMNTDIGKVIRQEDGFYLRLGV